MSSSAPQRQTRQRTTIAEVLGELDEFKSAQDIHDILRHRGHSVGLATVYRNLQSLVEAERVDVVRTPDGQATYRACGEATHSHHHHLVCRSCGRAVEIEFEGVEDRITALAAENGFTGVDHSIEVHGLCAACSA
ncbi:MAG: Fur family transcriptional regulator [Propioniciclava sp.]|uniref:Fur family transcriptional regulator n=1 Tax=Propioniciclava sp. TaxID=2038686 RepID=UPI0039E2A657